MFCGRKVSQVSQFGSNDNVLISELQNFTLCYEANGIETLVKSTCRRQASYLASRSVIYNNWHCALVPMHFMLIAECYR